MADLQIVHRPFPYERIWEAMRGLYGISTHRPFYCTLLWSNDIYPMLWMCQCLTRNIDYYSLQRFLSGAIIIWYADISIYTHIKLRSIPLESKTHWWDGVAQYRIARALKDENNRQWRRRFNKLCDNFNPLEVVSARRTVPPMHFCIPSQQQQEDTK